MRVAWMRQRIRRTLSVFGLSVFLFAIFVCLYNSGRREMPFATSRATTGGYRADQWQEVHRRILSQISFKPQKPSEQPVKIYVPSNVGNVRAGFDAFQSSQCAMRNCFVTRKHDDFVDADVVLLDASSPSPDGSAADRSSQLWVLYLLESPANTHGLERFNGKINYTASYRWDSDLVTPYGALTRRTAPPAPTTAKDYSSGKSRKVAWFVSNCVTSNNRMQYARELARHIQVDIFGGCVDKRVPRSGEREEMLRRDYKFFLAFENSNCADYVTEKFFDALGNDVIPIAFGESLEFYEEMAPPHSFIHVEQFPSAEELARYLHRLDGDPTAYNEYFRWKRDWRLMDTKFWCRLCSFVQEPKPSVYNDVHAWWHRTDVCHTGNFTGI